MDQTPVKNSILSKEDSSVAEEVEHSDSKKAKMSKDCDSSAKCRNFFNSSMALSEVKNPFQDYEIAPYDELEKLSGRHRCPKCNRSRKYYCYTCYIPIKELQDKIPQLKLPYKVDVIKHSLEGDGKSTACHAAVLAPADVHIYTYPDIPEYSKEGGVVLVYPASDALSVEDFISRRKNAKLENPSVNLVEKLVFIDSTWLQTKAIIGDPKLAGLPRLILSAAPSNFWRYQKGKPMTYLATIEAIFHSLKALHPLTEGTTYSHEYDNLLFFFRFMHDKIHHIYYQSGSWGDPSTALSQDC